MKFSVTRTSSWSETEPPCDGAVREETLVVRPSGGTYTLVHWTIEFASIDDLAAFTREHDRVIVSTQTQGPPLELEIYDDYRE